MPPQQDDVVELDGTKYRVQYVNSKGMLDLRAVEGEDVRYGVDPKVLERAAACSALTGR